LRTRLHPDRRRPVTLEPTIRLRIAQAMSLLKKLFGGGTKLDGDQLARSGEIKEYAQIDLLVHFLEPAKLHEPGKQQRWSRALPHPYAETIRRFRQAGWLAEDASGCYRVTAAAMPFVQVYQGRLAQQRAAVMAQVREALAGMETSAALTIRRAYEASFPLGKADWTGPDPQLSHGSLTRRIFFVDQALLAGLSKPIADWLKQVAAEQHLWGVYWRLPEQAIPDEARQELARPGMDLVDAVYWRAYQLALHVDNQETWQRCKGGDHVRRIEIVPADDGDLCPVCAADRSKEYLVARTPALPHAGCTCTRGCLCRYEPVLETLEEAEV
jgi:hypothetical protein